MVHRVRLKLQKSLDLWHFSLTKAAVYGRDPNWGRIACAAGYAGVSFDPNKLRISLREILLIHEGQPLSFDRSCILFLLVLFQTFLQVMLILDSSISSACKVFEEFSELISSRNCKIFLISKELSIWLSL